MKPSEGRSIAIEFSPSQRRTLALMFAAIPVLVCLVAFGLFLQGCLEHYSRMATLERDRLAYQTLLTDLPRRKATIAQIDASGLAGAFFATAPVARTAHEIQQEVIRIGTSAGVTIVQESIHAHTDANSPVLGITEEVSLVSDIGKLTHLLYDLGQARPFLIVERLIIHDVAGEDRAHGPHQLNIDLVISGYMRQPA